MKKILKIRLGRRPGSNRFVHDISSPIHQTWYSNNIAPRPQPGLLQALPEQRLGPQNHFPPSAGCQMRNLRPQRGVVAHLQNHSLVGILGLGRRTSSAQKRLDYFPGLNFLGRGRWVVRNPRDNGSGLLQTLRHSRVRNMHQRRQTRRVGIPPRILFHDGLDFRTIPVDDVYLARAQPFPHDIHGRARGAATTDNQRGLTPERILAGHCRRLVAHQGLAHTIAVRVGPDIRYLAGGFISAQENRVTGARLPCVLGEIVQVLHDIYLPRHGHRRADEFGVRADGGKKFSDWG